MIPFCGFTKEDGQLRSWRLIPNPHPSRPGPSQFLQRPLEPHHLFLQLFEGGVRSSPGPGFRLGLELARGVQGEALTEIADGSLERMCSFTQRVAPAIAKRARNASGGTRIIQEEKI